MFGFDMLTIHLHFNPARKVGAEDESMSNGYPVSKEDSRTGKDEGALFVGVDVILAQSDSCLLLVH